MLAGPPHLARPGRQGRHRVPAAALRVEFLAAREQDHVLMHDQCRAEQDVHRLPARHRFRGPHGVAVAGLQTDDAVAVVEIDASAAGRQRARGHDGVLAPQRPARAGFDRDQPARLLVPVPFPARAADRLDGVLGDRLVGIEFGVHDDVQHAVAQDDLLRALRACIRPDRLPRSRSQRRDRAPTPSVTYTVSSSATSRRISCAGPRFSGQRCGCHFSIGRCQRMVPLNASRATASTAAASGRTSADRGP